MRFISKFTFLVSIRIASPSAFFKFVLHIVQSSTEKKMSWVNTCWKITGMTYHHTSRNIAINQFPHESMRSYHIPMPFTKFTVPILSNRFLPCPTFIGFISPIRSVKSILNSGWLPKCITVCLKPSIMFRAKIFSNLYAFIKSCTLIIINKTFSFSHTIYTSKNIPSWQWSNL